jgi:hypothetical protein
VEIRSDPSLNVLRGGSWAVVSVWEEDQINELTILWKNVKRKEVRSRREEVESGVRCKEGKSLPKE